MKTALKAARRSILKFCKIGQISLVCATLTLVLGCAHPNIAKKVVSEVGSGTPSRAQLEKLMPEDYKWRRVVYRDVTPGEVYLFSDGSSLSVKSVPQHHWEKHSSDQILKLEAN